MSFKKSALLCQVFSRLLLLIFINGKRKFRSQKTHIEIATIGSNCYAISGVEYLSLETQNGIHLTPQFRKIDLQGHFNKDSNRLCYQKDYIREIIDSQKKSLIFLFTKNVRF